MVTRDGAALYKNAIKNADENIIQVSDKFHIIKNLIDAVKDDLKKFTDKIITLDEVKYDLSWMKTHLSPEELSIKARKDNKQDLIDRIRIDYNENNMSKKELINKYQLEGRTINRYLENDASTPRKYNVTELIGYSPIIYQMLMEQKNSQINYHQIYTKIKSEGYSSSYPNFYKQLICFCQV